MKILFVGDVVGKPGRDAICALVPALTKELGLDFVVVNAENAAGGSGITPKVTAELFSCGVDVFTSGDHIWKRREILDIINQEERILRPVNYPSGAPGRGACIYKSGNGTKIGVINVQGRVFMHPLECPFKSARKAQEELSREAKIILVDIHAEATSEKIALGWYLDGLVSAVVGTHTHVQTADECILPGGTAYITDLGMAGPMDGVIGRKKEEVLERFVTSVPVKFSVAENDVQLQGVVLEIDEKTGKAQSIVRIKRKL